MLLIRPIRQKNGSLLFPDHNCQRTYLHPAAPHVLALDFQAQPPHDHRLICDVELGASEADLQGLPISTRPTASPLPWEPSPVKLWGLTGGRPRLLSQGTTSGLGSQRAILTTATDWVPAAIILTADLTVPAQFEAQIRHFAWANPAAVGYAQLAEQLDRAVQKAWQAREQITWGDIALTVVQTQQTTQALQLETEGADAVELAQQCLRDLAAALLTLAYSGRVQPLDLLTVRLTAQRLAPQLPDLSRSSRRLYHLPLQAQIGRVPGKCTLKVLPGFDWSQITSVRVHQDADPPAVLAAQEISPWATAVLSPMRESVQQAASCAPHLWAEADYRHYPQPILLPSLQQVEDTVLVDAPPLTEKTLTLRVAANWPADLLPLAVTLTHVAASVAPASGTLALTAAKPVSYTGLTWADQAPPIPPQARVTYPLPNGATGSFSLELAWDQTTVISPEALPRLQVAAAGAPLTLAVAQGASGPLQPCGQFELSGKTPLSIYLASPDDPIWVQTQFWAKDGTVLIQDWHRVEGPDLVMAPPETRPLKLSITPEVPQGTALWLAPAIGATTAAQKIELGPFPTKVPMLVWPEQALSYRIALVVNDGAVPPAADSTAWVTHQGEKLIVTGRLLADLASR